MRVLRAELYEMEQRKKDEEVAKLTGEKKDITWGSQIRSYAFQPHQMVKDHRTGKEVGNVSAVMDGLGRSMQRRIADGAEFVRGPNGPGPLPGDLPILPCAAF